MQYSCIIDTDFKVQNKNWQENHITHNGDYRIYMLILVWVLFSYDKPHTGQE